MTYTIHKIAQLSGVTIKTLYYYHKIGLLKPEKVTENGYRIYGDEQLKRLQQILFYRELEFSLDDIKKALADEPTRLQCLRNQHELLKQRQNRTNLILQTLETTISHEQKGEVMEESTMFQGLNKEQWEAALSEQNEHLKKEYGYDLFAAGEIKPEVLNEQAQEAKSFMGFMAQALKDGRRIDDPTIINELKRHITFLNDKNLPTDAQTFANQTRFFLLDDFHRNMLENQQTGLSYYLFTVAERYAASN